MSEDMPKAYEGDRDYVFVGYSHYDRDAVLPIIRALVAKGFRVWYDEGIELAEDYPEYVADHVYRCACFIMFVSKGSLDSGWCRHEVNYALDLDKKVLPIYLEDVELTRGLAMRMGNKQALFWNEYDTDEEFNRKLFKARRLESCLSDEGRRRGGVKRRPGQNKGDGLAANGTNDADKGVVVPMGGTQSASQTPHAVEPKPDRKVAPQIANELPDSIVGTRTGVQASAGQLPASSGQAYEDARARFLERMAQEAADKPRNMVLCVEPKDSLAQYSWAELKQISQAIAAAGEDEWMDIAKKYRLVDAKGKLQGTEKGFELVGGAKASVRILGFRHDVLEGGGVAGISFEFAGVPAAHRMNAEWTNAGGWKGSEMHEWLNDASDGFLALLPGDLLQHVAVARKRTNNKGLVPENDTSAVTETNDTLWLLSVSEVYGRLSAQHRNVPPSPKTYDAEGTQYQFYRDKKVTTSNYSPCQKRGASSWWWLRSPSARISYGFHRVNPVGGWFHWGANRDSGVSPGFCF